MKSGRVKMNKMIRLTSLNQVTNPMHNQQLMKPSYNLMKKITTTPTLTPPQHQHLKRPKMPMKEEDFKDSQRRDLAVWCSPLNVLTWPQWRSLKQRLGIKQGSGSLQC
eukprot:1499719-Ditylum_brightwellii.AAC.1